MNDKWEYRSYWHGELMCPEPRKYYQMTRSYESMREEWEMLHPEDSTENQIAFAQLAYLNRKKRFWESDLFICALPFIPVWVFIIWLFCVVGIRL